MPKTDDPTGGNPLQGRPICPGRAEGEVLASRMGISFFGGVDPDSGIVVEKGHDLEGKSVAGRVLVFPTGKGSTVGSYTLYRLARNGLAPKAILNTECEPITAVGCILAGIPCVDRLPLERLLNGERVRVDGKTGLVEPDSRTDIEHHDKEEGQFPHE
jgi:predicted aconitase with swiveling domain